jgi:hypothetical protein
MLSETPPVSAMLSACCRICVVALLSAHYEICAATLLSAYHRLDRGSLAPTLLPGSSATPLDRGSPAAIEVEELGLGCWRPTRSLTGGE